MATLEPVFLADSTISFATLHNEKWICRKDIRSSGTVKIEKAGRVVPAFVNVVMARRNRKEAAFHFPVT